MPRTMELRVYADANVRETWRVSVPDDVPESGELDYCEEQLRAGNAHHIDDEVFDERNRVIDHIQPTDAPLVKPSHTPNGYDLAWVSAINGVMEDRETNVRVADLDDHVWERFIGPLCDAYERGEFPHLTHSLTGA